MEFGNHFKKILITGGNGFIGSNLIEDFFLNESSLIFNIDKNNFNSFSKDIHKDRIKNFNINLIDSDNLTKVIFDIGPDLIFHLAAESHVDRSIDKPSEFISSNIFGTFNLLESIRLFYENIKGEKKEKFKLIHISTDEVFGSLNKVGRFNEQSRYSPTSPYSASKAASDHLVKSWFHTYKIPTLVTNCSNNYGPYQFPDKLIPLVINKCINFEEIPIYGNGLNIRDWLYVKDHISALKLIAEKGCPGSQYVIGASQEKTNLQVVETICEFFDDNSNFGSKKYRGLITFVEDRPGHDKRYAIDASRVSTELGWKPKYNFKNGLFKTIDWYLKNIDWTKRAEKNLNYFGNRIGLG